MGFSDLCPQADDEEVAECLDEFDPTLLDPRDYGGFGVGTVAPGYGAAAPGYAGGAYRTGYGNAPANGAYGGGAAGYAGGYGGAPMSGKTGWAAGASVSTGYAVGGGGYMMEFDEFDSLGRRKARNSIPFIHVREARVRFLACRREARGYMLEPLLGMVCWLAYDQLNGFEALRNTAITRERVAGETRHTARYVDAEVLEEPRMARKSQ